MELKEFEIGAIAKGDTTIYIMEFPEYDPFQFTDRLTEAETERLFTFKHHKRRQEFVATRILRHQLFGFEHIHYDVNGAPFIESEGFISISHGNHFVGIAVNSNYKIGLDLEVPRKSIIAISEKFLSETEKTVFNILDDHELTKIWSAKEVLYKLAGRKQIHFKHELLLDLNNDSKWQGRICNPDHDLLVELDIFESGNTIISINSNEVKRINKHI